MHAKATLLLCVSAWAGGCSGCHSTSTDTIAIERHTPAEDVPFDATHGAWTAILRDHVRANGFDYTSLAAAPEPLYAYLAGLTAVSPETMATWSEAERYAFWINAYNAFTVFLVVDHYPLDSIRDLSGLFGLASVFDDPFIPLGALSGDGSDARLSLSDVENEILRARFQDARVHAAINCASKSCPPLRSEAFVAGRLETQLDEQMTAFVGNRTLNHFDVDEVRLELSKIFDWFAEDFRREAVSVRAYVSRYTPEYDRKLVHSAPISFLPYDWSLNQARQ